MDDLELLSDFVQEAREHLGDIEIQLLQIEATGEAIDGNLVNTVFRAIHSIKGAAGFLGLTQISAVSQRLEDVLGKVRDKQLIPDPFNVDVMLKAADRLKSMIESIESSNETDNSVICEKLDAILQGNAQTPASKKTNGTGKKTPAKKPVSAHKTGTQPTHRSGSAAQPKTPAPKNRKTTRATKTKTSAKTSPKAPDSNVAVCDRVNESFDKIDVAIASVATDSDDSKSASSRTAKTTSPPPAKNTTGNLNAASLDAGSKQAAGETTIRVGVRVLDRLMNLVGELVLSRNQLMQALAANRGRNQGRNVDAPAGDSQTKRSMETSSKLDTIASELDKVTTELQQMVSQFRVDNNAIHRDPAAEAL